MALVAFWLRREVEKWCGVEKVSEVESRFVAADI